jgi:hypothetical protein
MKKTLISLALSVASIGAFAQEGLKPIGYPGSNWSVLTYNPGVVKGSGEEDNVLLQGKFEQGVDWFKFGADKNWKFNTYVSLGYSADKNGLSYNNKLVPALGAKISRSFDNGVLDLGVQAVHENHFRGVTSGPKSGSGVQVYASYWFGWNLGK